MGLDIVAFEKAKLLSENFEATPEEIDFEGEVFRIKINSHFKSHDHLVSGIYAPGGGVIEFSGGSYGTYNGFRYDLCMLAHNVDPQRVWNSKEIFEGGDFFELINFSDCDGAIGPTTARKLFYDFKKHREAYHLENNEWDNERYDDWMKAMELASNDGVLIFC
jgi:hypothetical protein